MRWRSSSSGGRRRARDCRCCCAPSRRCAGRGSGRDSRSPGPRPRRWSRSCSTRRGSRVAGRVSEDEKWRLLGRADVLCAPSLGGESFGMVLTEAFASHTPVVASDIAGYRDVVRHGRDGLLVPAADPSALGEALRALAVDPELRRRMAESARERAERFSWTRVTEEVCAAYGDAIEAPEPVGPRRRRRGSARPAARRRNAGRSRPSRPASIEPDMPGAGRRSLARAARRAAVFTAGAGGLILAVLALRAIGIESITQRPARRDAGVGAHGVRRDVRLHAPSRRGLARDPARRAARLTGSPARHRAGDHDRRADVRHPARAARRAVASPDRRAAPRPRAASLSRSSWAPWCRRRCSTSSPS